MTPKYSVIVPVYNAEKQIRRCVDSILAQTFTDFELLLIDDGSKDASPAILKDLEGGGENTRFQQAKRWCCLGTQRGSRQCPR